MFITMVLIPPLMRSAEKLSFIDTPGERKVHEIPIPRIGGVAMVAGAVTPVLMWVERPPLVLAFLIGIGVILVFGVWDDRKALDFRLKFLGQFAAIAIVVFYGGIEIRYLPFHSIDPVPSYVSIPFTFFALLGVTNAINLADGLDGLAGGTVLLSVAAIGLLAFLAGDDLLVIFCLAVMGSIIGFLRYNTYPAQVFMGDTGSQFLGFSVGVLVIILTQDTNPALSPSMTLLILGLPIIDTFIVMGQRVYEGRSPFKPDRNHIHHKLLAIGLDHYEAVLIIYVVQAALVTSAFLFRFESDLFNMLLFSAFLLGILGAIRLAMRVGWSANGGGESAPRTPIGAIIARLRKSGVLSDYPVAFVAVSVPCYVLYAIMRSGTIPWTGPYRLSCYLFWPCRGLHCFANRRVSEWSSESSSMSGRRWRCITAHDVRALPGSVQLRNGFLRGVDHRDRHRVPLCAATPIFGHPDGFSRHIPRCDCTRDCWGHSSRKATSWRSERRR